MENREETGGRSKSRWFIDLDWYQQNQRSFALLARRCLCPDCLQRLGATVTEVSADELISAVKECCSTLPYYITPRLPLLESVFRVILSNGNRPLELEELVRQLDQRRGGYSFRTSEAALYRLLENDRFYGLCPVEE